MNSTRIFVNNKQVGEVTGNVFKKHIYGSRHLLRQPPAIMFDIQSLADAQAAGATIAKVIDDETRNIYTVEIKKIFEKPIFKTYTTPQVGLHLSEWTCNGIAPAQKQPAQAKQKQNIPAQQRLF